MATHSSILAWKIAWTEEAGGLQSMGLQRVRHNWAHLLLLLSRFSHVRLCVTHRRQPTRLPRPWVSPGKNTGVGCHFLLQRMKVKSESEVTQLCPTLRDPMDCSLPGSSVHGIFQAGVLEWGAIAFSEHLLWTYKHKKASFSSSEFRGSKGTLLLRTPLWGILPSLPPPHHPTEENWHIPNSWHKPMLHGCLLI